MSLSFVGLHIPESYLTALVQATCRKNGWPLDRSTLYTQVTQWQNPDEVTERAHQGMLVIAMKIVEFENIVTAISMQHHWNACDLFQVVLSLACIWKGRRGIKKTAVWKDRNRSNWCKSCRS